MGQRLVALVSVLAAVGFLWHLAATAACSAPTATVGACAVEAGLCLTNLDCLPTACDASATGICPTHCTVDGLDTSGYTIFRCALGPPGTGDAGTPCMGPDECAVGACAYEQDFTTTVCTGWCKTNADCPSVLPYCVPLDAGGPSICGLPP